MVIAASVNIIKNVESEHRELDRQYQEIRTLLRDGLDRPQAIQKCLTELAVQLKCHFSHEEEGGYFAEIITLAPRLSSAAEALQREHGDLLIRLDQLVDRLSLTSNQKVSLESIRRDFEMFLCDCDRHESQEDALVQEAYLIDIGIGD